MRTFPKAVFSEQKRCLCVGEKAKMHRKSDIFQNTHVAAEKAQVYCNHSPITADITADFTLQEANICLCTDHLSLLLLKLLLL